MHVIQMCPLIYHFYTQICCFICMDMLLLRVYALQMCSICSVCSRYIKGHICITYTLKNNISIHIKQPIYTYLCVKEVYQGTHLYNIQYRYVIFKGVCYTDVSLDILLLHVDRLFYMYKYVIFKGVCYTDVSLDIPLLHIDRYR